VTTHLQFIIIIIIIHALAATPLAKNSGTYWQETWWAP